MARSERSEGLAVAPAPGSPRSSLEALAEQVRPTTLARERRLPVLGPLEPLLAAGGLRRGSVVEISAAPGACGSTTLALALAAGASAAGSWTAGVGLASLGLAAAAEVGVALERLVLVAAPERPAWPTVVAALVDGFDIVLVRPARGLRAGDARRLVTRARERGAVLVALGSPWVQGADLRLAVQGATWEGLGGGHGHLRARRVVVGAAGRGEAARPRRAELWLPGPGGGVDVALDPPVPLRPPGAA